MDGVTIINGCGLSKLFKLISQCEKIGTELVLANLQFQLLKNIAHTHPEPVVGLLGFINTG
jgi:SulP family sulfate permease